MSGGPPKRQADCHPERKHHARGYCSQCYRKNCRLYNQNPVKATCHPDRAHKANGLCDSCYTAKKNKRNPEKVAEWTRAATLRVYGLTPEMYDDMYRAQGGLCAICKNPPKLGRPLDVDHDHVTNLNRGLLCRDCNLGLGSFKDNSESLQAAIVYLYLASNSTREVKKETLEVVN
jgi:hypothetical protein